MPMVGEDQPFRMGDIDVDEIIQPLMPRVLHGSPSFLIESPLPAFMLREPVYSDEFLLRDLKKMTLGDSGIGNHHPEVRQAVFDSLQHHPSLLQHYLRS
jgi:hypothetical protein